MQAISYEGTIDIQRLVRRLVAQDYRGFIATEYVWMQKWACDRVDNLCETIYVRNEIQEALADASSN